MRRSILMLCLSTTIISAPAFAKDIIVSSEVSKATIYNDRAKLIRSAEIDIPEGSHTLVLRGLPIQLDTNSLRVSGISRADVSFGALSHKQDASEDFIVPKEKELNDILVKLQDERKIYQAEKEALSAGKSFLDNLGKQAVLRENEAIAEIDLDPESWGAVADTLTSKIAQNLKASIALDIKMRDVNNKIAKVKEDLKQLRTGQKRSYTVSIPFDSNAASTLELELSYQVPDAGWYPVYDARLDTQTGQMELVQFGSVWQRTGEDWGDVSLTLSTAQPSRGASLPQMHTQWVNIHEKRLMKAMTSSVAGANVMALHEADEMQMERAVAFADSAMPVPAAAVAKKEVYHQAAVINADGFVGEYKITGLADVKSDGTNSKLLIGAFDLDSQMQIHVKPKYDPARAYLVAMATLKGEAPILPGQVSLFRDGAFIGQGHLPMLRQGDETSLGFGIDDNISVSYNITKDERGEDGVITKSSVIERHFITKVKNLRDTSVEVAVFETLPVSQNESVKVELISQATSKGYESDIDDKKGVMRWVYSLQPKQEQESKLGWKVSWPKGDNISGL